MKIYVNMLAVYLAYRKSSVIIIINNFNNSKEAEQG